LSAQLLEDGLRAYAVNLNFFGLQIQHSNKPCLLITLSSLTIKTLVLAFKQHLADWLR
jgi:hypothetical protein